MGERNYEAQTYSPNIVSLLLIASEKQKSLLKFTIDHRSINMRSRSDTLQTLQTQKIVDVLPKVSFKLT